MKRNKLSWLKIILFAVMALILAILLIKVIDYLFQKPGNTVTAIDTLSSGEVLTYLGGILAAIATGILSYLVYKIEARTAEVEREHAFPFLELLNFNEDPIAYAPASNCSIGLNEVEDKEFSVADPETGVFLPAILVANKNTPLGNRVIPRQYIFEFRYTGEIRCKEIQLNQISFFNKSDEEVLHREINYKYPVILANKDTVRFYLYYVSNTPEEITNGKIILSYCMTTLAGTTQEYEVELEKKKIPLNVQTSEIKRKGNAEVLKKKVYLKEPRCD